MNTDQETEAFVVTGDFEHMTPNQRKFYLAPIAGIEGFSEEGWPLIQIEVDQHFHDWWMARVGQLRIPVLGPGRITCRSLDYMATCRAVMEFLHTGLCTTSVSVYLVYRGD